MKYPINSSAIIDVTKPPYCVDNTGKEDCTKILIKILDDILINQVIELQKTHDKLLEMSDNKTENVYIGLEGGRVQKGEVIITFPENEPTSKIIYFPNGTYLVSDTVTYSLNNLKQYWYWVPGFENNRNIHFMGESKQNTVIRLKDNATGFEKGKNKPVISFVNNPIKVGRNEEYTNVAFMNTVKDITIDCGFGNDGAVGIKYVSSNCGKLDNINIKTDTGKYGIEVDNNTSQAVFKNINITGFDYGIESQRTNHIYLKNIDVSGNKISGLYTCSSVFMIENLIYGDITAIEFKQAEGTNTKGRYYFIGGDIPYINNDFGNHIYSEKEVPSVGRDIPVKSVSSDANDWVCVDDFGAKGDGITDSTRAIQKAMNSGKPYVVFGEGEYFINAKIKIPASVKLVDFMYASLAAGDRLIGGEYDSAFEVSEDSIDVLFIENLSAWEKFKGHIRLIKHNAKRDLVMSDIHLMSASVYFNTVCGSKVYFENCFSTTGTYVRTAWLPGEGFVPVYCSVIPYEFHGQTVYGCVVNPERADVAVFNDNSDVLYDGLRTEGCGTALESVNGGKTKITTFNAGCGCKEAENPLFDIYDSEFEIINAIAFGVSPESEYNKVFAIQNGDEYSEVLFDDLDDNISAHGKIIKYFKS